MEAQQATTLTFTFFAVIIIGMLTIFRTRLSVQGLFSVIGRFLKNTTTETHVTNCVGHDGAMYTGIDPLTFDFLR